MIDPRPSRCRGGTRLAVRAAPHRGARGPGPAYGGRAMEAFQFDTMAKAAATGVSRRQVLRGLLATAGGGTLVHLTGGESDARLSRCCWRAKQAAEDQCSV